MKQSKLSPKQSKESMISSTGYSRDKPNPHLREFVKTHNMGHPHDPKFDDYAIKAFDKPITTSKVTAIYNMHTYWSKKPQTAITEYIRHYTKLDDIVLDPMCGSGGTALSALIEGRKAIAIDLSPAATFITANYCAPVDIEELEDAFEEIREHAKSELDWLYETRCDACGGKAITVQTVYSKQFQCPRCLDVIPLFDCIEIEVPAKTQVRGKPTKTKIIKACPKCKKNGHIEEISTRAKSFKAIPVLISYECKNGCLPKRRQRRYNDDDPQKREYFSKYDLAKIAEIEQKTIPYWYPPHRMMNVESNSLPWGEEWRPGRNFRTVAELFTKRNLWALSLLRAKIDVIAEGNVKDTLLFVLTGIMLGLSKMNRYMPSATFPFYLIAGTYYLPQISCEEYVWKHFENKKKRVAKGKKASKFSLNPHFIISTENAGKLNIPSNSIDYVFTDPPYGGKVQYGELNFIWEAWLNFDTHWHSNEIVVNGTRGLTELDWCDRMKQVMGEVFRVLKPGRWVSLCYHDTSEGTWQLLQDLMTEVGFIPEQTDSALYIDTEQKSFNQITADKVTKRDLVFNYRKPRLGESTSFLVLTGNEDSISFNEKARAVIRDFLLQNPGSTQDRIYDALISHMVSRSQMQSHNFSEILRIVGESTSVDSSSAERWYLKDTELDIADVAETAKEDNAAQNIRKFIEKYLKENPEYEGVHFSDIFEHYLYIVKDKPRRALSDWLLDYFYLTSEGTYRPPLTIEEATFKATGRVRGLNRKIKRLVALIEQGIPVPETLRPDNVTLAEWILHSRRAGLYSEGKLLFERAGLVLDALDDETQVDLEEAYQTCNKIATTGD